MPWAKWYNICESMVKNKKLHIIGILAIVPLAMAARGAFADKVVALPSLPEAGLPNSEVTTNIALNVNWENVKWKM